MITIDTECTNVLYPEFPNALFGEYKGNQYFNATRLYNSTTNKHGNISDVEDVLKNASDELRTVWEAYPRNETAHISGIQEHTKDRLIHECLLFVFLRYLDADFCVYCNEVIKFMFIQGFVLSDSMLAKAIRTWITPEIYQAIRNEK